MRRALSVTCMVSSLLFAASAHAGDYVDTRLNFTITDENLLVKPGETTPSVPGVRIGAPNSLGILFFDNYDTRYTGYENLTHLVIYKSFGNERVTAEAAYVLRLLQFTDVNLSSIDDGSYIRLVFWLDKNHAADGGSKTNLALTAFPLNADACASATRGASAGAARRCSSSTTPTCRSARRPSSPTPTRRRAPSCSSRASATTPTSASRPRCCSTATRA